MDLGAITDDDICVASRNHDLDQAVRGIQERAEIMDGGVAAVALAHVETGWSGMEPRQRRLMIRQWLDLERAYSGGQP